MEKKISMDLITYKEAAELTGRTRRTLEREVFRGRLVLYKNEVGESRLNRKEVEALYKFKPVEGKMINSGSKVRLKHPQNKRESELIYEVVEYNDRTNRVQIKPLNLKTRLLPIETVSVQDVEVIN